MSKDWLTDEQVEIEIERLREDPYVQLARKEQRLKYRRRQALYQLRNLEKRGKELDKLGYTYDDLEKQLSALEDEENKN